MLITAFREYPEMEWQTRDGVYKIDRLAGGPALREWVNNAASNDPFTICEAIRESWQSDVTAFEETVERYRRY